MIVLPPQTLPGAEVWRKGEAGAGNVRLRQLLGGLCSKRELRTGETAGCRRQGFFGFVFEGGEITAQKEKV